MGKEEEAEAIDGADPKEETEAEDKQPRDSNGQFHQNSSSLIKKLSGEMPSGQVSLYS